MQSLNKYNKGNKYLLCVIHLFSKYACSWKRTNTRIRTYFNCRKNVLNYFTVTKKKFCLSLHYNGAISYLFVNGTEIYKFKAKDSEIVATPLCLGNISKDWSADNMKKKQGLMDFIYDFMLVMMLLMLMILKTFTNI